MPYASTVIANSILQRAFHDHIPVTPMKLQRVVFFAAADYAKSAGRPLLAERFEPWPYGPVIRSLDEKFKPFRSVPIDRYAGDAAGAAYVVDGRAEPRAAAALDNVWEAAKDLPPVTLSRITHLPGSAWCLAVRTGSRYVDDEAVAADRTYCEILGL